MLSNFPKIHCPFKRKIFKVDYHTWKQYGKQLKLRKPEVYLAVNEINPGYEWVFNDKETFAVEKLDGTNIKLQTENGRLIELMNRKTVIDPLQIIKGKVFIIEGIFMSIQKGYILENGIQAGELIGPKLQGNPYQLDSHLFYPFSKTIKHLKYNSFNEHDRTYDNLSMWFQNYLVSRFSGKRGKKNIMAEGIIIYNLKRKAENKIYMAKLRRDMFYWFYSDKIAIL